MEIKNTPSKASLTSSPPKKTKKVWWVKRASSESSTPGSDEPKINWATGGVLLTNSKRRALTERMFSGGNTSAWENFIRADRTKCYVCTYVFSQIHQDNYYKCPGTHPITKMKTCQLESQNLAWGDPIFNHGRYVHPNYFFISCLSLLNKEKCLLKPCAWNLVYTLTLEMMNGC
jgi:hypothetical protein